MIVTVAIRYSIITATIISIIIDLLSSRIMSLQKYINK